MFENTTFTPDWVSPPGDTIAAILDERGLSRGEFAKSIRRAHSDVDDLICGHAEITADLAERLADVLGSTASFWTKREARYRLDLERLMTEQLPDDLLAAARQGVECLPSSGLDREVRERQMYAYLRARGMAQDEIARLEKGLGAMIHERRQFIRALDYLYMGTSADFVRELIKDSPLRSVKTPWGTVGFRRHPARLQVIDKQAVIDAVESGALPSQCVKDVRIQHAVYAELESLYKTHGEIPPGCDISEEEDDFFLPKEK